MIEVWYFSWWHVTFKDEVSALLAWALNDVGHSLSVSSLPAGTAGMWAVAVSFQAQEQKVVCFTSFEGIKTLTNGAEPEIPDTQVVADALWQQLDYQQWECQRCNWTCLAALQSLSVQDWKALPCLISLCTGALQVLKPVRNALVRFPSPPLVPASLPLQSLCPSFIIQMTRNGGSVVQPCFFFPLFIFPSLKWPKSDGDFSRSLSNTSTPDTDLCTRFPFQLLHSLHPEAILERQNFSSGDWHLISEGVTESHVALNVWGSYLLQRFAWLQFTKSPYCHHGRFQICRGQKLNLLHKLWAF